MRFAALGAIWRAVHAGHRPDAPSLRDRARALPRLVLATARGRYRGTTIGRLALIAVGVVYVVSPIDLVPELFVPLLGLLDDAVVVAWLAGALLLETERFLDWERDGATAGRPAGRARGAEPTVVRGEVVR